MILTFHGAARMVTGSKHLISLDNGFKILLDCGLFQGLGPATDSLNQEFHFDSAGIDAVLLSHAHIDHSGLLPKLVKEGFTGNIYCTVATQDLTEILLLDSAAIQMQGNEKGESPLYDLADVKAVVPLIKNRDLDEWFSVAPEVSVMFTETGHLVGGVAIHLRIEENGKTTSLSFSGDVGRARHPLLRPAASFPQSEYIILESTYGDRHHDLKGSNLEVMLGWITDTCIKKNGKLVIPAFSVGRTQELLYLLNQLELEKRLPAVKYFVDSPLSRRATETVKSHLDKFNDQLQGVLKVDSDPFQFEGLRFVETAEDSARLVDYDEPCVIISASGTGDNGRVRRHINKVLGSRVNSIVFSGYCGPDTLGGRLMRGEKAVEIFGETKPVIAEIGQLKGLSAHGDMDDLCEFVACQDPGRVRAVFLVHGETRAQEALAHRLSAKGFHPVLCPSLHETVQLNRAQMTETQTDKNSDTKITRKQ